MSSFVPEKEYLRGILLHYFIQKKSAAKAEFLLRLTAAMLCRKQPAEIALDTSKIMILMSKIKNALAHR